MWTLACLPSCRRVMWLSISVLWKCFSERAARTATSSGDLRPLALYGAQRNTTLPRHVHEPGNLLLQPQAYKHQLNLLQIISKLICCSLSQSHSFDLVFISTVPQMNLWESCRSTSPESLWWSVNSLLHPRAMKFITATTITTMTNDDGNNDSNIICRKPQSARTDQRLKPSTINFRWRERNAEGCL